MFLSPQKISRGCCERNFSLWIRCRRRLEGVRRQWALNKNVSDEANASFVKSAAVISNAYAGIDFTELIQETNEIGNELGISQEGALGMADALLKWVFHRNN